MTQAIIERKPGFSYTYFAIVYSIILVSVAVLGWLLETYFKIELPSAAMSVIGVMITAMSTSDTYVAKYKRKPDFGLWGPASLMALISTLLSLVFLSLLFGFVFLTGASLSDLSQEFGLEIGILIVVFAIAAFLGFLISIPIARLGLGLGIRTRMKALEKSGEI